MKIRTKIIILLLLMATTAKSENSDWIRYTVNGKIIDYRESDRQLRYINMGHLPGDERVGLSGTLMNSALFVNHGETLVTSDPIEMIPIVLNEQVYLIGPHPQQIRFSWILKDGVTLDQVTSFGLEYFRTKSAVYYVFVVNNKLHLTVRIARKSARDISITSALPNEKFALEFSDLDQWISALERDDPEALGLFDWSHFGIYGSTEFSSSADRTQSLFPQASEFLQSHQSNVNSGEIQMEVQPLTRRRPFRRQLFNREVLSNRIDRHQSPNFTFWEIPAMPDHYVMSLSNGIVAIVGEPNETHDSATFDGYQIIHTLWPKNIRGRVSEAQWNELMSTAGSEGSFEQPRIVVNQLNVSWQLPFGNPSFNARTGRPSGSWRPVLQCSQIFKNSQAE